MNELKYKNVNHFQSQAVRNHLEQQRSKGSTTVRTFDAFKAENLNMKQKVGYGILTSLLTQAADKTQPDPEQILMNIQGKDAF